MTKKLKIYKPEFLKKLHSTKNPYGDGLAVEKIMSILQNKSLNNLLKKKEPFSSFRSFIIKS